MVKMLFSESVLRQCPVVVLHKQTITNSLLELVNMLMPSELGAGQIASYIKKKELPTGLGELLAI